MFGTSKFSLCNKLFLSIKTFYVKSCYWLKCQWISTPHMSYLTLTYQRTLPWILFVDSRSEKNRKIDETICIPGIKVFAHKTNTCNQRYFKRMRLQSIELLLSILHGTVLFILYNINKHFRIYRSWAVNRYKILYIYLDGNIVKIHNGYYHNH